MGLEALVLLMAVLVAWLGLAIIGLARRVIALESRIDGGPLQPLAFEPGDRVPAKISGSGEEGVLPPSLDLRNGEWLLLFATSGCSACGRAAQAVTRLVRTRKELSVAILVPDTSITPSHAAAIGASQEDDGWLKRLTQEEISKLIVVPLNEWSVWEPRGVPTVCLCNEVGSPMFRWDLLQRSG